MSTATSNIVEIALLSFLIILAFLTVNQKKLRRSVIYLGAFSTLSAFAYLYYQAPDVALAEAFIGCTISVLLFLTALKRYRVMTIYLVYDQEQNSKLDTFSDRFTSDLEEMLMDNEFEPQRINTFFEETADLESHEYDLLIICAKDEVNIFSHKNNYHNLLVIDFIERYMKKEYFIGFYELDDNGGESL